MRLKKLSRGVVVHVVDFGQTFVQFRPQADVAGIIIRRIFILSGTVPVKQNQRIRQHPVADLQEEIHDQSKEPRTHPMKGMNWSTVMIIRTIR